MNIITLVSRVPTAGKPLSIITDNFRASRPSRGQSDHPVLGAPVATPHGYGIAAESTGKFRDADTWMIGVLVVPPRTHAEIEECLRAIVRAWRDRTQHLMLLDADDLRRQDDRDDLAALRADIDAQLKAEGY